MNITFLKNKAQEIRKEIFLFKTSTGQGHLASSLSPVDILVYLFYSSLSPFDKEKDKIIFSKAHGSPSIYPILADLNFFPKEELLKYSSPEGILKIHSDYTIPGCHFVGGSLGNGLGYSAGRAFFNKASHIYVIVGDAELYEGTIWESLLFISHYNINNLTIIVDRNGMGILGRTEEMVKLEPLHDKFAAFGFNTVSINGHDFTELDNAFNVNSNRPRVIIAKTIKAKGVSYMEDRHEYHNIIPKSKEQVAQGIKELTHEI